jgi:cytoskeletal protein CcmA (bactofilin family)
MVKKGLWISLLLVLLLWPASTVLADARQGRVVAFDDGQIFVDEDVTLEAGERFDGDLGVFNGDLTMPQGSTVNGDVFVANGDAEIAGRVNGDLAVISGDLELSPSGWVEGEVFGMSGDHEIAGRVSENLALMLGSLELESTAVVGGDVTVISGSYERQAGAQVLGEEVPNVPLPRLPFLPDSPRIPEIPEAPAAPEVPSVTPPSPPSPPDFHGETLGQRIGSFFGRTMTAGFLSLVFVGVGLLIVLIWPRNVRQVADCISALPLQSFGLGLLTFLIAVVLEALAVVVMILIILVAAALISTIILIPIGLLLILLSVLVLLPVPLALAGGMVLGWVGLAEMVGQRVLKVLNFRDARPYQRRPLGAVLAGLLVTVPLAAVLWVLRPLCCAWPFILLLTSVGLGAVIHTRFGTQSCRESGPDAQFEALPAEAMDQEAGYPDAPSGNYP